MMDTRHLGIIIAAILLLDLAINDAHCIEFQWHNVNKNVYFTEGEDAGLHWIFRTTASELAEVRLAFAKQGTSYERYIVVDHITLDSFEARLRNKPNIEHDIACDYTNGPLRSIDCIIKRIGVDEAGSYRLYLELQPNIKKHVSINVFVNYDYKLLNPPRNIRVYPQETATWTVSFQNPVNIIPVFPIKISISYSNLTTDDSVLQLVLSEIFSNRIGLLDLTLATDVPPVHNRICFTYEEGNLTMFFWNISKGDSGSFQIVSRMGSKEGPFQQSILTHTVVLVVLEDSPPDNTLSACNTTCNTSICVDLEPVNCNSTICNDCKIHDHAESENRYGMRCRRTMNALGSLFSLTFLVMIAVAVALIRTKQKPGSSNHSTTELEQREPMKKDTENQ